MKETVHDLATKHPEVAGLAAKIITALPRVNIENRNRLQQMKEWLRSGSIVAYFVPHTCIYDPLIVTQRILKPYLKPTGPEHFAWLSSSKFFEEVDGVPKMGAAGVAAQKYAERMGYQMLEIYQQYRLEESSVGQREKAKAKNFLSLRAAVKMLQTPGSIVGVSPEGTRGTTGGLLRGNDGIRLLLKPKSVIALPVILSGVWQMQERGKEGLDGLRPFISARARIGIPLNYEEAVELAGRFRWKDEKMGEFTIADALMMHAAAHGLDQIKPRVDPRGVYARENICVV